MPLFASALGLVVWRYRLRGEELIAAHLWNRVSPVRAVRDAPAPFQNIRHPGKDENSNSRPALAKPEWAWRPLYRPISLTTRDTATPEQRGSQPDSYRP